VCCVFGCHLWKAGGLFDGLDVQCTEQTNFDDYSMMMFDPTAPRPEVCQQADPDNVVCQLEGKYTLHLNKVGALRSVPSTLFSLICCFICDLH
jgi:hypothetical protein